jgi:hypothetical protein
MKNNEDVTNFDETIGDGEDEEMSEQVTEATSDTVSNDVHGATKLGNVGHSKALGLQGTAIPAQEMTRHKSSGPRVLPNLSPLPNQHPLRSSTPLSSPKSSPLYQSHSAWPLAEHQATLLRHYVLRLAPWVCTL